MASNQKASFYKLSLCSQSSDEIWSWIAILTPHVAWSDPVISTIDFHAYGIEVIIIERDNQGHINVIFFIIIQVIS